MAALAQSRRFSLARPTPFQARTVAPRQRIVCGAGAATAPVPAILKAIGEEEVPCKTLWPKLSVPPASFKSRTYLKSMVDMAKKKAWVAVKYDGTDFVYYLTEKGKDSLSRAKSS